MDHNILFLYALVIPIHEVVIPLEEIYWAAITAGQASKATDTVIKNNC